MRARRKAERERAASERRETARASARGAIWPEDGLCPLCGRPMTRGPSVNDHHLVPRSKGGRKKWAIHKVCHGKIHSTLSEKELAERYFTFEALRAHPEISAFVAWVRKKEPTYVGRHR